MSEGDTVPTAAAEAADISNPDRVTASNFMQQLGRFVDLSLAARDHERSLKDIEGHLAALDEPLRMMMAEQGIQNMRVKGLTVYIHRQLWAGAAKRTVVLPDGKEDVISDKQATCDALIACGHAEFVEPSFNTQTVSAWVRELPVDENTGQTILPPELEGNITLTEKFALRTRR